MRVKHRFPRFAGFRIAKQPTFLRNKFGMSETSCCIGLFSKFVKFHLVQGGNRQEITCKNNVVQGGKISLIKRSKNAPERAYRTHAQTFFSSVLLPSQSRSQSFVPLDQRSENVFSFSDRWSRGTKLWERDCCPVSLFWPLEDV